MDEIGFVPKIDVKSENIDLNDLELSDLDSDDEFSSNTNEELNMDDKDIKLKKLQNDLEEAVNSENYEKAAELRDQIKKLEISNLN